MQIKMNPDAVAKVKSGAPKVMKRAVDKTMSTVKTIFENRIPVDSRREKLEAQIKELIGVVRARTLEDLKEGKWTPTHETARLEEELLSLADEVILGYATYEDFKARFLRWEVSGKIGTK